MKRTRSCTNCKRDILAGISKPGDRVKEREESERRGKEKRKAGRRKGGKEGERKKDTADGAWTLRLRDHRLILSFIMLIPQTGIVPVCDVRFFLRSLARRAHQVVIFAGPQIVNEDINLVRALMSTREFIALNAVSSPRLRLSRRGNNLAYRSK